MRETRKGNGEILEKEEKKMSREGEKHEKNKEGKRGNIREGGEKELSLIHISEPTRRA